MTRAYRYTLRPQDWRRADIALLRRYAETHTAAQIAAMLGRTHHAVYCKASDLGISMLKDGDHDVRRKYGDDVAREAVRRYFSSSESQQQIADSLGIPRGLLARWVNGTERPHLRKEFAR